MVLVKRHKKVWKVSLLNRRSSFHNLLTTTAATISHCRDLLRVLYLSSSRSLTWYETGRLFSSMVKATTEEVLQIAINVPFRMFIGSAFSTEQERNVSQSYSSSFA